MKLRRYLYGWIDGRSWLFGIEWGSSDCDTAWRAGIRIGPLAGGVTIWERDFWNGRQWLKDIPQHLKAWWEWQRLSPEERSRRKQEERGCLLAFRADAEEKLQAWTATQIEEAWILRNMGNQ